MSKTHLTLHPSEGIVTQAAAYIYAAYVVAGLVPAGAEVDWINRSVKEAVRIAELTDSLIVSDNEMG